MTIEALRKLLESDALLLYAQPKWTFGQNTCNTYEVFVEKIRTEDGTLIPSREIVDEIERDPELTLLFSEWFLRKAVISALTVTEKADANVTLSVNLLPLYANQPDFAEQVRKLLDEVTWGSGSVISGQEIRILTCCVRCILTELNWTGPMRQRFRAMNRPAGWLSPFSIWRIRWI